MTIPVGTFRAARTRSKLLKAPWRVASFPIPGPSFSFNRDGERLVHTVCACAELRAARCEKGVCDHGSGCDLLGGEGGTIGGTQYRGGGTGPADPETAGPIFS